MLILARSLRELRFGELAAVYTDSIEKAASECPDSPHGLALQMAENDLRQYLREVFFPAEGALCAVWEVDGRYVSALRLEPYRDGLLLEGLETAPDQRRKGYATMLIQTVLDCLADRGSEKVYSHINKGNTASRKTHIKCGFHQIADYAVYIDGSVDHRCCTMVYESTGSGF